MTVSTPSKQPNAPSLTQSLSYFSCFFVHDNPNSSQNTKTMSSADELFFTEDDLVIDEGLGYPKAYAKICRDRSFGAFTNGPPFTFMPFSLPDDEVMRVKKLDEMFPIINPNAKPTTKPKIFLSLLWKQLNHLGNAGFDQEMFRVDAYGNVLYYHADPASPLAWDVDHWFPCSRGGFTVPSNLRILQWQVCRNKQDQLEYLIPWWDLQVGISINQFLSIFAARNSDFRHRAFSWLFSGGESEELNPSQTVDSHSFPQHFKESKDKVGLAPAAIVLNKRGTNYASSSLNRRPRSSTPILAVSKKLKSSVKENEDPNMENNPYQAMVLARDSLRHRDQSSKMLSEIKMLDEEVIETKMKTEDEKLTIQELELVLTKRKRRAEKCRRLAEAQSSYRLMLEKMIRDAMHQSVIYKEQVRLNQAASHALMARLEAQKAMCDSSERDLHRKYKQKDELEKQVRPEGLYARKRTRMDDSISEEKNDESILLLKGDESKAIQTKPTNGSTAENNLTNVLYLTAKEPEMELQRERYSSSSATIDDRKSIAGSSLLNLPRLKSKTEMEPLRERYSSSSAPIDDRTSTDGSSMLNLPRLKCKAQLHKELRVFLNEEEQEEYIRNITKPESPIVSINTTDGKTIKEKPSEIQETGKIFNFRFPGLDEPEKEEDEESRNQRGKGNVEKWLQALLENSNSSVDPQNAGDNENAGDKEKRADEIIRKLNLVYPSQDKRGAYAKDSEQRLVQMESSLKRFPQKGKEEIIMLKPRRNSTSSSLQDGEKAEKAIQGKDALYRSPPYTVNNKKNEATDVDSVSHEVKDKASEGKKSIENTGKEKELTRSESARIFRRIPSSPSLILNGMKKRVDCIGKKPKVMGDDEGKKDNVAEDSFLKSSIKTIKRAVKF